MRLLAGAGVCLVMATAGIASVGDSGGRTIEITIVNSHYSMESIPVDPGETVTFVITNEDPISHEFVVGDAALQDRHEDGTERYHDAIPTEVTVPPGERVTTTFEFGPSNGIDPGEKNYYACHLPGHFDYGMVGRFEVE